MGVTLTGKEMEMDGERERDAGEEQSASAEQTNEAFLLLSRRGIGKNEQIRHNVRVI